MRLQTLKEEAHRIAREHGFTEATPLEDLMLVVTEVAEAAEDIRRGKRLQDLWYEDPDGRIFETRQHALDAGVAHPKPCGVPSELADVIIRIAHFSGKHGIDITRAVEEKMLFNETRPFKHGKTL